MDPRYTAAIRNDLAVRREPPSRSRVEAWWTTLNQLNTGAGFRIGYVLRRTADENPEGEVWFTSAVSGMASANVALAQRYPSEQVAVGPDGLPLQIGPCSLEFGRITGMLPGSALPVTWDLVYAPVTESLRYLPELHGRAGFQVLVPYPFMMIGGKIQIGDHRFVLNGDPGQQQHTWGGLPGSEWIWFHCSSFASEGGEPIPAYVTGLSRLEGRLARAPRPRSYGHFVWKERHLKLQPVSPWESRWSDAWVWRAPSEDEEIRVAIAVPWSRMIMARHQFEGRALISHYSTAAECTVSFSAPRLPPRIFRSAGTHVEVGSRRADPRPVRIVETRPELQGS
jgi:hypothetical protein